MADQISATSPKRSIATRIHGRFNRLGKRLRGGVAATAGGALMLLGTLGSLPAIALTDEEFKQRLDLVPVFTVLREDNRPVVVFPQRRPGDTTPPTPADARILSFLDPEGLEKFMERLREEDSEAASRVTVLVSSVGEVYQWGTDNHDGPQVQYVPIISELPRALELAREVNPDLARFPGVPLFVATNSENNGYLTLEQNGRKVVPFFFRLEDLNTTLETFRRQSPTNPALNNINIEVSTLGQVINVLKSSAADEQELAERIRLIPSGETMRYIGGLQQSREGATPQRSQESNATQGDATPTPSPTGAGALMP